MAFFNLMKEKAQLAPCETTDEEQAKKRIAQNKAEAEAAVAEGSTSIEDTIVHDAAADDSYGETERNPEETVMIHRQTEEAPVQQQKHYRQRSASAANAKGRKSKRKRGGKRSYAVMVRLNPSEYKQFKRRVEISGLSQSEFMRQALLNGVIVAKEPPDSYSYTQFRDDMIALAIEIGRIGALIRMGIVPNEAQKELNPDEWNEVVDCYWGMKELKIKILDAIKRMSSEQEILNRASGEQIWPL